MTDQDPTYAELVRSAQDAAAAGRPEEAIGAWRRAYTRALETGVALAKRVSILDAALQCALAVRPPSPLTIAAIAEALAGECLQAGDAGRAEAAASTGLSLLHDGPEHDAPAARLCWRQTQAAAMTGRCAVARRWLLCAAPRAARAFPAEHPDAATQTRLEAALAAASSGVPAAPVARQPRNVADLQDLLDGALDAARTGRAEEAAEQLALVVETAGGWGVATYPEVRGPALGVASELRKAGRADLAILACDLVLRALERGGITDGEEHDYAAQETAVALRQTGDRARARETLAAAVERRQARQADDLPLSRMLGLLAQLALDDGDPGAAVPCLARATRIRDLCLAETCVERAVSHANLAGVLALVRSDAESVAHFLQADELFTRCGMEGQTDHVVCLDNAGELLVGMGEHERASALLSRAARLGEALGESLERARTHHLLGLALSFTGSPEDSTLQLHRALELYERLADPADPRLRKLRDDIAARQAQPVP